MHLSRVLPLLLLASQLSFAEGDELPFFQTILIPEKYEVEFKLEDELAKGDCEHSISKDISFEKTKPSVQTVPLQSSKKTRFLSISEREISLAHTEKRIDIQTGFLAASQINHMKFLQTTHAYSVIPWRIVKEITLSQPETEPSYCSSSPMPKWEEKELQRSDTVTYYSPDEPLSFLMAPLALSQEHGILSLSLPNLIPPSGHMSQNMPSYSLSFSRSSTHVPFSPAAQPLMEESSANPSQETFEAEKKISFPQCTRGSYSLHTPQSNHTEQDILPEAQQYAPPLAQSTKNQYSYFLSARTSISEQMQEEPTFDHSLFPTRETLAQIHPAQTFPKVQIDAHPILQLPVGREEGISCPGKNPFIFHEKKIHTFSQETGSFSSPSHMNGGCTLDGNYMLAHAAEAEKLLFFPKKVFLFVDVQSEKIEQHFAEVDVDISFFCHESTSVLKQPSAYHNSTSFKSNDIPKDPFLDARQIPLANQIPRYEESGITLPLKERNNLFIQFQGGYPIHLLLDPENGYVACTGRYTPMKATYSWNGVPSFYRQNDWVHLAYSGYQAIETRHDLQEEPYDIITYSTPQVALEGTKGVYSISFQELQERFGIRTDAVYSFHNGLSTGILSKNILPLPDTRFVSNVLWEDMQTEFQGMKEIWRTLDFTNEAAIIFSSLFPKYISGSESKAIPTSVNVKQGMPTLKSPKQSIAYSIDDSKHINDGYRLTSYNLTRLPSPEELDIDEYMDSLSTSIEVIPRNDGEGYYFALTLSPEKEEELTKTRQNVVFFLDRTSSILAPRYDAYRNGVIKSLQYLNEGDTFNIVVVDSNLHYFEEKPVAVTRATIRRARRFLQDLPFPKLKRTNVDLYDLLYELQDFFTDNGNVNTAVLVSDGLSLFDMDHKGHTLRTILKKNQGAVTLHCAAAGGKNNSAMLDLISTFLSGELAYAHSVASFPRKLARLVKKTNALLSNNIHVTPVTEDRMLDIEFFTTNERMPHFYSGKPFTIYGSINKLENFKIVIQGKVGKRFMHYAKEISFATAQKSPPELYRFISINKAYAYYDLFLKEKDPNYLREAKGLLEKYKLPAATKKRAAINEKRLMRERLDIF